MRWSLWTTDCELLAHPNITGDGCPCGLVVVFRPPPPPPEATERPVLALVVGEATHVPKANIRVHGSWRRGEKL